MGQTETLYAGILYPSCGMLTHSGMGDRDRDYLHRSQGREIGELDVKGSPKSSALSPVGLTICA
jgi:hypothetical protein